MPERTVKTAAELESMIIAELREHPECESAAVRPSPGIFLPHVTAITTALAAVMCTHRKVPKRKPGYRAGPSLRTYYSPVKSLRANLTRQEIGKAWRDRGDKMVRKQK